MKISFGSTTSQKMLEKMNKEYHKEQMLQSPKKYPYTTNMQIIKTELNKRQGKVKPGTLKIMEQTTNFLAKNLEFLELNNQLNKLIAKELPYPHQQEQLKGIIEKLAKMTCETMEKFAIELMKKAKRKV